MSLDACTSGASGDAREPISLNQAVLSVVSDGQNISISFGMDVGRRMHMASTSDSVPLEQSCFTAIQHEKKKKFFLK